MDGNEDKCAKESINSLLLELSEAFMRLSPDERAYKIVRNYADCKYKDDEICRGFYAWLLNGENQQAKELALERLFREEFSRGAVCRRKTNNLFGCKAVTTRR
jgi:hypothetical protein